MCFNYKVLINEQSCVNCESERAYHKRLIYLCFGQHLHICANLVFQKCRIFTEIVYIYRILLQLLKLSTYLKSLKECDDLDIFWQIFSNEKK